MRQPENGCSGAWLTRDARANQTWANQTGANQTGANQTEAGQTGWPNAA